MNKQDFDVVVVGAGSGGLTSAVGLAKVGKKVLLIERDKMGGECTNSGCIPSKALLHHAKNYALAKQISGVTQKNEDYRKAALLYVQNKITEILKEETPEHFEKIGIKVKAGEAIFKNQHQVQVGDEIINFRKAIIATGSSPRLVEIPGLRKEQLLTNQNLFNLTTIPEKLLVVGGGPIGLEMGQAFALLGSTVTILENSNRFARLEDEEVSGILAEQFKAEGINLILNTSIKEVAEDVAKVEVKEPGNETPQLLDIPFTHLLLAIGRTPNLPQGLKEAGIESNQNGIVINNQYQTSQKNIYALGDVAARLKFTHVADDAGRQVVAKIASRGLIRIKSDKAVPKVTYTSPEVSQVGMLYTEAVAEYNEKQVVRLAVPYHKSDRAKTDEETSGLMVVVAERLSGKVLGANIIGEGAGEMIALFTLAIDQKISLYKLQKLIFAYPTYSLLIKKAGDQFLAWQIANLKSDLINRLKRLTPKLIAGFFWLSLISSFHFYRVSNGLSYNDVLFSLIDFFTHNTMGPIIYMGLYALRPLIFFPATILTALSGALFGFWWGTLFTILGENASANLAYAIGRYFGKDLHLEKSILGRFVTALKEKTFATVLLMRLFYVPFDLTNYGAGVVRANWREYFYATLIGIMPGLTTFVALGAALDLQTLRNEGLSFNAFAPEFLALSVVIFIVSLYLSKWLKKKHID